MSKTDFGKLLAEATRQRKALLLGLAGSRAQDAADPWPYSLEGGRILYHQYNLSGELVTRPVADFGVTIAAELVSESGAVWYRLQGQTATGRAMALDVSLETFTTTAKLVTALTGAAGAQAPILARMEHHLRPAIQKLTGPDYQQLTRYERTGWTADGQFLIPGREVSGTTLTLPRRLPYRLGQKGANLEQGLLGLRYLVEALPIERSTVALTTFFQAPLARLVGWENERYALFITGQTNAFKTAWAQCAMCLWGDFEAEASLVKLGEGATLNALLRLAVMAADLPLLLDNYKPNTGLGERRLVELIHLILEGGDRDRLTRDSRLMARDGHAIHTWPILTGEDTPGRDAAGMARLLTIPFAPAGGGVNEPLSEAQKRAGHLPAVGAAWLDWLMSEQSEPARQQLQADFGTYRTRWAVYLRAINPHGAGIPRQATHLATNQLTFRLLNDHPDLGPVLQAYQEQHRAGLQGVAAAGVAATTLGLEAGRFLITLSELVTSKRCELLPLGEPGPPSTGHPDRFIGWRDQAGIYLMPALARSAVERVLGPEGLGGVSSRALYEQLRRLGVLATLDREDNRTTRVKRIGSQTHRVLPLKPDALDLKDGPLDGL